MTAPCMGTTFVKMPFTWHIVSLCPGLATLEPECIFQGAWPISKGGQGQQPLHDGHPCPHLLNNFFLFIWGYIS